MNPRACRLPTVCILACIAASAFAQSSDAPLSPRVAVKTGAVGALSDAGIFIAYEKGFFRDEGLDVELVTFKVGPQIIPSLATNQTQVTGLSVSPSMFNALERGVDLKLVADKGQVSKGFGWAALMVRTDLAGQIRDLKDLRGRTIGLPSKGVSLYTQFGKALALGGLTVNDVKLAEIGFPEMLPAFTNKVIDASILIEPFVALLVGRGAAVRWKGVDEYYPFKAQNGVVMYSEKFGREQPEAARRWMRAYLKGTRAYRNAVTNGTDRDEIYRILAKHTAVKNLALYSKMQPIDFATDGKVEVRSLELDQDWFMQLGLQKQRADMSKVIDYRYVDYANTRLGKH
jgi:NitT/TauT family transport system substrate-binding protein